MARSPSAPRVLVAEDEIHVSRLIHDTLVLSGYSVDLFRDGGKALRRYRANTYGLLILDQILPGRSGMQILEALRERGDSVPAILMAGRSRRTDLLESQAFIYQVELLRKPFGVRELRSAVERSGLRDPP